MMNAPLYITPVMVERVWGGNRLSALFAKAIPPGKVIGESWELCDREDIQSVIADGPHEGRTLRDVLAASPNEVLGKRLQHAGRFPLLIKYIDAGTALSVQVHPDDAGAQKYNDLGKSECWVVLHAEPGAEIIRGLKPGTTVESYQRAVKEERVEEVLRKFKPKAGDVVALPAGMVHAIGAGLVVAEIQQSSDITFRIYDYKRLGLDGKPRALHVEEALSAIRFDDPWDAFEGPMRHDTVTPRVLKDAAGAKSEALLRGKYFELNRHTLALDTGLTLEAQPDAARVLMIVAGAGTIQGRVVKAGETALVPACCPALEIVARSESLVVLESTPA